MFGLMPFCRNGATALEELLGEGIPVKFESKSHEYCILVQVKTLRENIKLTYNKRKHFLCIEIKMKVGGRVELLKKNIHIDGIIAEQVHARYEEDGLWIHVPKKPIIQKEILEIEITL